MNIKIEEITYNYVSEKELYRILDKIDIIEHNQLYSRNMIECHIGEKNVKFCIQSYKGIPLSIGVNKFNSYGENDATCIELQSVIGGYALYMVSRLITDIDINYGKDLWLMVDSTNVLYDRLLKFYSVFQKRFNFRRFDIGSSNGKYTFFYSYPCQNELSAIEYFKRISSQRY